VPSTTGPHRPVTPLQLTPAWRFDSPELVTALAGDSNHVYAVTAGPTAVLVTLDATTGRQLWSASLGQSSLGQPVASGGLVATVSSTQNSNSIVQVRDGATGRLLWQRGPTLQLRPLLAGGDLVVELSGSGLDTTIVGLDLRTGQQRWSLQPSVGHLINADTDRERLFLPEAAGLYAIDGRTGRVKWTHRDTKGPAIVTADDHLVLAAVDHSLPQSSSARWRAIDPASGATHWTQSLGNPDPTHEAVAVDGQVVTPSDGLRAYASAHGPLSWSHPPTRDGSSPPLATVSNHLLTAGDGSAGAAIEELDPSDGAVLRATPVSSPGDILALDHLVVVETLDGLAVFRY
jgi:outer membrane protein assembly factor BamB